MKYIDLVIDNKSDKTDRLYTYQCEEDVLIGNKVHVPFARGNKLRDAYVVALANEPDDDMKKRIKCVESVDEDVSLSEEMIATASWIKTRYLCRYIDAIKLFTPVGSKAKRRAHKDPLRGIAAEDTGSKELTQEQEDAIAEIEAAIDMSKHERFLIHGVTGSGKTEIYMRAAEDIIAKGKTVIILVPEISLTGQIVARFVGRFGTDEMAIMHSRLSAGERYDQWQRIRSGDIKIVIGARSAVFAPLDNIGLIVIDEEHETTYKSDMTPKYDTIEVALKRTQDRDNNGILILGSATPSVVTYKRAEDGIYRLIRLTKRYNEVPLPIVDVVDMREELRSGNKSIISQKLFDSISENLKIGKQVMLFLNRRGYSTFLSCRECGHVLKCPECGLSLTYHKENSSAICHYCGRSIKVPHRCPECGSKYIKYFGSGTEKLQESVARLFPDKQIDRLDFDTIKAKGELNKKLRAFAKKKTDILIGTQIIAKGLDFKNVGLVGVVSADVSLNIPDFRSPERTFQLITQAAGRAGRGDDTGQVIIQTYNPDNYAIIHAAAQDYEGFYREEIAMRELLAYPPYSDMCQVMFTSENPKTAFGGALEWYHNLRANLPENEHSNIFYPQEAYMSKIKNTYRYSMLVKCPQGKRRQYTVIMEHIRELDKTKKKKEYTAVVDINPYSFG